MTALQLFFSVSTGALLGLIPMLAAFNRGKQREGGLAFFACLVAGMLMGVIGAVPAAIAGYWFITKSDDVPASTKWTRIGVMAGSLLVLGGLIFWATMRQFRGVYDKEFRQAFQTSLMANCMRTYNVPEKQVICDCLVDGAMTQLTTDKMRDKKGARDYIVAKIMPRCEALAKSTAVPAKSR